MPYAQHELNLLESSWQPQTADMYNNQAFWFWCRSLLHRAQSAIEINGLPDKWSNDIRDFLFFCLFRFGYVVVWDAGDPIGLTFQPCTLGGRTWYYTPAYALVANPNDPRNRNADWKLDLNDEHVLMRLTPDYSGVWDVIMRYAEQLAQLDAAIQVSIVNCKTPYITGAKTKAAAQTLKRAMDLVNSGNAAVVYDEKHLVPDEVRTKDSPFQNMAPDIPYHLTDQLKDAQTILNAFDSEIGIPTIPYQKAERMVTTEANSRQMDGVARATRWVECLNDSFKMINKAFGLQLDAKLRFDLETESVKMGGDDDAE